MKHKKQILLLTGIMLIAGLILYLMSFYIKTYNKSEFTHDHGGLNISNWEYGKDSIISLAGEWEFYWNKFVSNDEIKNKSIKPDIIVSAPKAWDNYEIDGKNLSSFGYATYRLKVTGAKAGQPLSLWMPTFSTAYTLYIDGNEIASNGSISSSKNGFNPEVKPQRAVFTPTSNSFDIIIQVSNFVHARGGMRYTLYLGTEQQIISLEKNIIYIDLFLIGNFFVMAFIYFFIFIFRKSEKSNLYFVLMCIVIAFRTMISGCYSINTIIPFAGYKGMLIIDYLTTFWFPIILLISVNEMFKKRLNKKITFAIFAYAVIMSVIVLIFPIRIFTMIIFIYLFDIIIFFMALYMFFVLLKVLWSGKYEAAIMIVGGIALFFGAMYDMLFQRNYIVGGFLGLSPIGFYIMILCQAVILSRRFALTIKEKEYALIELKNSNERERQAELKFLKSQIRQHFIHNVLNTIISVSRKDIDRSRKLLVEFSSYLRGCFDFNTLEDIVPAENELSFVRSYVILEQSRFGDMLNVEYEIETTDIMLPPLVLQPLVENAIIHGIRSKPDGGNIVIYIKKYSDCYRIGVRDDGVGIDKEKTQNILSGKYSSRGVGINNINQRLLRLYSKGLEIISTTNGTDIYMQIPLNGGQNSDESNNN